MFDVREIGNADGQARVNGASGDAGRGDAACFENMRKGEET